MALHAVGGLAALLAACAAACVVGAFVAPAGGAEAGGDGAMLVYFGGAGPKGGAISLSRLDLAGGELTAPKIVAETPGPTFQVIHPTGRFLYTVNEGGKFAGQPGGGVSAYAIADGTGELTLLNGRNTGGAGTCHISLDPAGKHVLGANYSGGSVFAMPIGADGRLGERTGFVQHTGKGPNPRRQEAPHAHSINLDPAGRFALACDLGLDKILVYRFDPAAGTLTANDPPFAATAPGAGPRHLAFHAGGRWVYSINELNSTMDAWSYDAGKGALTKMQTLSTLPDGFEGNSSCAEVLVHPSGKFVYGSNRGHDSIAMYSVDAATGKLTSLGQESTRGKHPRNFRIDPTGAFLLVANRDTNNVVVFRIDPQAGTLKATGQAVEVRGPNCVKFLRVK